MYLKNLTLKGFKSFAETTSIDLEPGVTVVVGPNGSGKSNVVDAVAWVLGAQAPSSVRSARMDDVIFAGTKDKAALGRAEVSLTIDNHSGMLPVEFNEVKITRTLFRNGDSEYSINGVPCRLLDITELLSHGGVGHHQHVIVSQGQIEAVLNARPEDRRAIIEEAAGVLKYRKRKDRAERRLSASDTDLTRVKDLMREVRRQLRPLEKQAEAARRHGDLLDELTALRIHLAGRELADLRIKLNTVGELRSTRTGRLQTAKAELDRLADEVSADERRLTEHGGDDLGDALVRLESMRERARGVAAVIAERRRGVDRERGAFTDRGVIANLEAEAARSRDDLSGVESELDELVPDSERLEAAQARLMADRDAFGEQWGDGVPVPSGRAAEVRGELGALRIATERGGGEIQRLQARLDEVAEAGAGLESGVASQLADIGVLRDEEKPLVAALEVAGRARAAAVEELAADVATQVEADAEHHRWVARADALMLALDEARARAGAERLADVDGVIGTLLELVAIDDGWEAAFESAVGEALGAVVVRDPAAARAALDLLSAGDSPGAVLAVGASPRPEADAAADRIRDHVRGTAPGVDELLDVLVGHVGVIDGSWRAAADAVIAHPTQTVVTKAGDRFGPDGWRIGAVGSGATGAALDEAIERVAATEAAAAAAGATVMAARERLIGRETSAEELSDLVDGVDTELTAAADALQRVEADRRDTATEAEALQARFDELVSRVGREQARVVELESTLPGLEADEAGSLEKGRRLASARAEIEARAAAVNTLHTDIEVRAAGLEERRTFLTSRLAEIDARLERDSEQRESAGQQRESLDWRADVLEKLAVVVTTRTAAVGARLEAVRDRRRRQSEVAQEIVRRLDGFRAKRSEADKFLENLRVQSARAEVEEAELRTKLQVVVERIRTDHGLAPDVAVSAPCPPLDQGVAPQRRTEQLESELEILGPVNPLALEEYRSLQERHGFLQGQLDDIRSTRRDLSKVITSIDEEIVSVFAAAFADVAVNFEQLFETLFPGGEGSIHLTTPDDLLNTGIEISARPEGKNVRKLSLLSGGERTLTALAFLFAVFRSRPSPFYVMDEVEAALDDVNLHRFLSLVDEFRADAQLVLVSHQKRTMEAADYLCGVSMKPGGSSKVVSERVVSVSADSA